MEPMPADTNRRYVLKSRPSDLPDAAHFAIESAPIPIPKAGELLVRILLVALSPWQGQRLKDFENYTKPFQIGELIDCDVLGQVVAGSCGGFSVGDLVTGRLGWQEHAVAKPADLLAATTDFDETLWLTALSSPGLTAYCALEMFGRPMPGETLVVTSAAGSVGSYAVQLGKLAGMNTAKPNAVLGESRTSLGKYQYARGCGYFCLISIGFTKESVQSDILFGRKSHVSKVL